MYDYRKFFIDGSWVAPPGRRERSVINPATEAPIGQILLGTAEDVDEAAKAARRAFESYSHRSREERISLLEQIISVYESHVPQLALALSDEMGAPIVLATQAHAGNGLRHFQIALDVLRQFDFEERLGTTRVVRE